MRILLTTSILVASLNSYALSASSLGLNQTDSHVQKVLQAKESRDLEEAYMQGLAQDSILEMKDINWKGLGLFQVYDINDYLSESKFNNQASY